MSQLDLSESELSLLMQWEEVCCFSFSITERMPKRVRFSMVSRLDNGCLEVLQFLNQGRYVKGKARVAVLRKADAELGGLKVLVRIAFKMGYLTQKDFERLSKGYYEAGLMLGGWIKAS